MSEHRPISAINADIERLNQERADALAAANQTRSEYRESGMTIADVMREVTRHAVPQPDLPVFYGPTIENRTAVCSVHSWRGRYDEPAIGGGYGDQFTATMAASELGRLTLDVFWGYKGGDYTYGSGATLYADDYGGYTGEHVIIAVELVTPEPQALVGDEKPYLLLVTLGVDA